MHEVITSPADLLSMLDSLLADRDGGWWDAFYADRSKPVPFFTNAPDENLVAYVTDGKLAVGKALEFGCGPGRNAIFLAQHGWSVDAVDFSQESLRWAHERARAAGVRINLVCRSVFEFAVACEAYDVVYDAGCLHHLPPHRRPHYLELLRSALRPSGLFGLTCFTPAGGADLTDWEVYRQRTMRGGLGYTEDRLRDLLGPYFEVLEFRQMQHLPHDSERFGRDFLWAVLMRKR